MITGELKIKTQESTGTMNDLDTKKTEAIFTGYLSRGSRKYVFE